MSQSPAHRALRRALAAERELHPIMLKAIRRTARHALRGAGLTAAGSVQPTDMRALVAFWSDEIDKTVSPAMLGMFQRAAEQTLGMLPGDLDVNTNIGRNIRDTRAEAWFGTVRNRLVGVGETMYQDVARSLQEAYAAGEGPARQAERVRHELGFEGSEIRAARVARTEGAAVVNGADYSVSQELDAAGIPHKREWLATPGPRTRETHAMAHGQKVGVSELFNVGGYQLTYPGDPSGPAQEVINCRCAVLLDVDEEAVASVVYSLDTPDLQTQLDAAEQVRAVIQYDKRGNYLNVQGKTKGEAEAWRDYTGEYGHLMNGLLRDPQMKIDYTVSSFDKNVNLVEHTVTDSEVLERTELLESLMGKADVLTSDITVARGLVASDSFNPASLKVGSFFADPAFLSTTSRLEMAEAFSEGLSLGALDKTGRGWRVIIQAPRGTRCLPGDSSQNELLFPPGMVQEVLHVDAENAVMYTRMVQA